MTLNVGATPVSAVYLGATRASGVYLGSVKVWPSSALTAAATVDPINGAVGCGPGYPVTITGSGLLGAAVAFGGVPAVIVSNDGATIVATVPATGYGYETPAGRSTPITATINGSPVDGSLPFTTFEPYNGYAFNTDTDKMFANMSRTWQTAWSFPLLGCRPGGYLKLAFEFGNSAIQWIPFDSGIRLYLPRTGAVLASDTESRTVAGWEGTITGVVDQHAGEQCQVQGFAEVNYDGCRTLLYARVTQQASADDPAASQQ